jgi:hypothetical protein
MLGEGEGAKLGEGCLKVMLSQDRMPISSPSPSLAFLPHNRLGEGGRYWHTIPT